MKIILMCTITFACGALSGALFTWWPLLSAPGASSAKEAAFSQWQQAAAASGGQVDIQTRDKLLPLMARSDGPRAWKLLMQSGAKPRSKDIEQIARQWATQDGRAATVFGLDIADPIERHAFLTVALSCWFGSEPSVFLKWLKTRPERTPLVACMNYLEYGRMLKIEVASLDDMMALYGKDQMHRSPLRNLVLRVWQHGHQKEAVMAWLRRQPESEQRDYAWRDIANVLALTDAPAASSLAPEVTSMQIRRYLVSSVTAWMAKTDAPAALAYAQNLPDDDSRNSAWQSAFGTWLLNDPAAALAHVRQHLDTITTDKVRSALGMQPAFAADKLSLLRVMKGSEQSRDSIVERVFSEWESYSREDMRRWLASPEAEWLAPEKLKKYRQMAESPRSFGSQSRLIRGRHVWIGG